MSKYPCLYVVDNDTHINVYNITSICMDHTGAGCYRVYSGEHYQSVTTIQRDQIIALMGILKDTGAMSG